jgi:hypothetical protein
MRRHLTSPRRSCASSCRQECESARSRRATPSSPLCRGAACLWLMSSSPTKGTASPSPKTGSPTMRSLRSSSPASSAGGLSRSARRLRNRAGRLGQAVTLSRKLRTKRPCASESVNVSSGHEAVLRKGQAKCRLRSKAAFEVPLSSARRNRKERFRPKTGWLRPNQVYPLRWTVQPTRPKEMWGSGRGLLCAAAPSPDSPQRIHATPRAG